MAFRALGHPLLRASVVQASDYLLQVGHPALLSPSLAVVPQVVLQAVLQADPPEHPSAVLGLLRDY